MSQRLGRLIALLDGTPNANGQSGSQRGQSLVELALVMPILIVLLMGMAEVGWFANNFLILLEVTRTGARYGTAQPIEKSPLTWNNYFSVAASSQAANDSRDCAQMTANLNLSGFYNSIMCVMLQTLDPLALDTLNGVDDIVISAFSFKTIIPSELSFSFRNTASSPASLLNPAITIPTTVAVGRYPTNANECGVWTTDRDPFDYFVDNQRDYMLWNNALGDIASNQNFVELDGYDLFNANERQLGWVYTGQHRISSTFTDPSDTDFCIGSEWTLQEVQDLMNVPNLTLTNDDREDIPSQGLILVEIFWKHNLLLKNPVFNPIYKFFGGESSVVNAWAAFPLPSTEPHFSYD